MFHFFKYPAKVFFISVAVIILLMFSNSVIAVESSTDAAELSDDVIKENIKERLEKVKKQDNDDGVLAATNNWKRAWFGKLEDVSNKTLTIKTPSGAKQAEISDGVKVIDKDRSVISIKNLEIESYVIAMGYLDQKTQVLDAKRVVVDEKPEQNKVMPYFVTIADITDGVLTVDSMNDLGQSWQLSTTKKTKITRRFNGEQVEMDIDDLVKKDVLVILAELNEKTSTTLDVIAIHLVDEVPSSSAPEAPVEN